MVNYSGVDLRFAFQKLCFLIGLVALLAGSALALVRRQAGDFAYAGRYTDGLDGLLG
ncbi:MAG: hypothetical protein IPK20_20485 [Betaproteobacteria bacterium]|nr:hypothetical protein [Betaproteobacteria bacterium]